jgi:hypothetical protein
MQLVDRWHELVVGDGFGESSIIDTASWLKKATLDAYVTTPHWSAFYSRACQRIGAGAFQYDFGALDGSDNILARTYSGMRYVSALTLGVNDMAHDL